MRLSLCDILNYPPHHRDQLLQLWSEEAERRKQQQARAEERRRIQLEKEAETERANRRPDTPDGCIEYHFDGKFFTGMPKGVRLLVTTEDRAETDLISGVPIVALAPDHPFWKEHRKTQPSATEEGPEPVTIPMPRREPFPPIPASDPPEPEVHLSEMAFPFEVQSWKLDVRCSNEAITGFPMTRAGPLSIPISGTAGASPSDLQSTNYNLRAGGALPRPDRPTKPGRPPIFDSTNQLVSKPHVGNPPAPWRAAVPAAASEPRERVNPPPQSLAEFRILNSTFPVHPGTDLSIAKRIAL